MIHSKRKIRVLVSSILLTIVLAACSPASDFDSPEDELAYTELQKDFEYRPFDFLDEANQWLGRKGFEELGDQIAQRLESEIGTKKDFSDPQRVLQILETYEGRVEWQGFPIAKANVQAGLKDMAIAEQVADIIDNATYGSCELDFREANTLIEGNTWASTFEQKAKNQIEVLGQVCVEYWADFFIEQQNLGEDLLTVDWLNLFAEWDPNDEVTSGFIKTYAENLN